MCVCVYVSVCVRVCVCVCVCVCVYVLDHDGIGNASCWTVCWIMMVLAMLHVGPCAGS